MNNMATFTVFAYPFRKKMFSGKKTRHRVTVTFEVRSSDSLEDNKRIAQKWKNVINCLARGIHLKPEDITDRCEPPPWGQFLVLVNPHSGPGRAVQIFRSEVEPMLEEAGIPFKLVITEYAGHARDLMHNLELSEWAAVVIVSGDGLVYEVINGLMQRVDWTSAIKKAVGCVPGGSGNALACSINYAAGEPVLVNPVLHSTFVLIKHRVVPMDLVLVQTPSRSYFSFLSVTWGIVADIDYESEKYRNLGEARFTLGAIKRIVNLRAYSGKLSFLPVAEYTPKSSMTPKVLSKIRRFSLRSLSSSMESLDSRNSKSSSVVLTGARPLSGGLSWPAPTTDSKVRSASMSGFSNGGGGDVGVTIVEQSGSETEASPARAGEGERGGEGGCGVIEDGVGAASPSPAVVAVTATETTSGVLHHHHHHNSHPWHRSSGGASDDGDSAPCSVPNGTATTTTTRRRMVSYPEVEEETLSAAKEDGQAVPTPLLPPLDQPVPEHWVVVQGRFVLACAIYQTHLGSDMLAAPSARLSDGVIHLMFVRDGISRNHLLNLFLSFSEGVHVDSPEVEFVPVLAFRLEPDVNGGNIMIDGERLNPVPVQGQVLPGVARIMAIQ
ncbi:sphingosine kinase 1-like [Babylonia areolata]|uniref:sphingosine kinase 1-like n=1 Tax=Babylonia areolata TaxID=304850 RepID=UPI003FD44EB8